MSRNIFNFDGAQPAPPLPAGWTFQHKPFFFQAIGSVQVQQLYPPPGPVLAEWFLVEADIRNTDFLVFGEKNTTNIASASGNPAGLTCITTLGPGESILFEPNDKGSAEYGFLTYPDREVVQLASTPDVDLIDVTQFWVQQGPLAQAMAWHATIGSRSRR